MEKLKKSPSGKRRNHPAKPTRSIPIALGYLVPALFTFSLLFWAVVFRNRLPGVTDTLLHIYPALDVNLREWQKGLIPLWNADWGCGMPHLASWQPQCLYPLAWWGSHFGSPAPFLVLFCLFHDLLAFGGGLLWLRSQGVPLFAAGLGALSFAGSAVAVECWGYPHHSSALAWIPWIFWACQSLFEKPQVQGWLRLVLFLSLQLLAGYPIFVFYTWGLLLAWLAFRNPTRKNLSLWMGASLFSLLLTAPQWLPFVEMLQGSRRGGWWAEFPYFTKPLEYLTLFKPDFLGFPGSNQYRGSPSNFAFNLYIGLVPLAVLAAGCFFFWKKNRSFRFWTASFVFLLLWLSGGHFPFWNLLPRPFLEALEPSKAVPLLAFCASTAAAMPFSAFQGERRSAFKGLLWGTVGLLWTLDVLHIPFRVVHPVPDPYQTAEWKAQAPRMNGLASQGRLLSLSVAPQVFSGEGALEDSLERPVEEFLADSNAVAGVPSAGFYMSLYPEGLDNLLKYINRGFPYEGDLLEVAGVRVFLLPQALPGSRYRVDGKLGEDFISLDRGASEKMRFVPKAMFLPDRAAALDAIAFSKSGWREKVYLESTPGGNPVGLEPVSRSLRLSPVLEETGNGRAGFRAEFPKAGYVVMNETFFPGWHAWVDGSPRPLLRAYGLFMAVAVGKGVHQVDFRYEPASFRLGLFAGLVALVLALGLRAQSLLKGFF